MKPLVKRDDKKLFMSGSLSVYRYSYFYNKFISFYSSYLLSHLAVLKITEYTSMATWQIYGTNATKFFTFVFKAK